LRNEIATWAAIFGVQEFDLYVGGREPHVVQGVPGETPALVVGPAINAPLAPGMRAQVSRELFAMARGTTALRSRDDATAAAVVATCFKLAELALGSQQPPSAEVEKAVSKAIPRRVRKLLPEVCQAIAGQGADARKHWARALASQARVAMVASGDVTFALADAFHVNPDQLPAMAKSDPRIEPLLRFALSRDYLDLRRALGLEGAS
jgi:hypothetical protein